MYLSILEWSKNKPHRLINYNVKDTKSLWKISYVQYKCTLLWTIQILFLKRYGCLYFKKHDCRNIIINDGCFIGFSLILSHVVKPSIHIILDHLILPSKPILDHQPNYLQLWNHTSHIRQCLIWLLFLLPMVALDVHSLRSHDSAKFDHTPGLYG